MAWCGNPSHTLPYNLLSNFSGTVTAIVGVAFNHTHPDAIEWLSRIGADVRIFKDDAGLFHPKIYLFREHQRYALFVGSSNFTYGGFYANHEINCLIEGAPSQDRTNDVVVLEQTIAKWRTKAFSFKPSNHWIEHYRYRYEQTEQKQRKQKLLTPPLSEEEISSASWLQYADWDIYYQKVFQGLRNHESSGQGYHDVLDAAARELSLPWKSGFFKDIEKRRIMGGIKPYGWLGHVAASRQVRRIFANGTPEQWTTIVKSINAIAQLDQPIPWSQMKSHLDRLVSLGPTMKVWGRLLCLVRPDLYCTVSAPSVRKSLSKTLEIPQNKFHLTKGYIQLIRLIHSSPWFNKKIPRDKEQAAVWKRRAALLDAIFY